MLPAVSRLVTETMHGLADNHTRLTRGSLHATVSALPTLPSAPVSDYQPETRRRDPINLISRMYLGLADSRQWTPFASELASFFDSKISQISIINFYTADVELGIVVGVGEKAFQRYRELVQLDPKAAPAIKLLGKVITNRDVIDDETYEASYFYKEVIEPIDGHFGLWVSLEGGPGQYCALAVMRGKSRGDYTEEDRELMGELVPHFRQVVRLRSEFLTINTERRIAAAALDHVAVPIFVLDAEARVQYRNDAASDLLHESNGPYIAGGRLCAAVPSETKVMREALRAILAGDNAPSPEAVGHLLQFTRPTGGAPFFGTLAPLWDADLAPDHVNIQQPLAILFVSDPARPLETPPELLQRLFGLTPAEAQVAALLAAGHSLQAIAEQQSVAVGTVRSQLKTIFSKTGTNRQGELVSRVLASSQWVRLHTSAPYGTIR